MSLATVDEDDRYVRFDRSPILAWQFGIGTAR